MRVAGSHPLHLPLCDLCALHPHQRYHRCRCCWLTERRSPLPLPRVVRVDSDQIWGPRAGGYYPYTGQIDTLTQAKYLARQWLVNTLEGVPSVWCKFLSGGGDRSSSGDMLGVVRAPYRGVAEPHGAC